MSLNKKLWLAIAIIMALAFAGTFVVSTLAAKRYFSEQLYVKNVDNATSLALSISQLPKDPVTIELLIAAQFDAGHYRMIRLIDPKGIVITERRQANEKSDSPLWFRKLVPLDADPGIAQVQDNWKQYATLEVVSHDGYAYQELWRSTQTLLGWFLVAVVLIGIIGSSLLRVILKPLDAVVEQARAIGERRYIVNPEPSTTEFRNLVRIMNTLSGRVRKMLIDESRRVEDLRRQAQIDPVSGLYKRDSFLNAMETSLGSEDNQYASGLMIILRIKDVAELNKEMGWQTTDQIIHRIGLGLQQVTQQHAHWFAGRLSGSDFAVLTPAISDPEEVCNMLLAKLQSVMAQPDMEADESSVHAGATHFVSGEDQSEILARVDSALSQSIGSGGVTIQLADQEEEHHLPTTAASWQVTLEAAMRPEKIALGKYPVTRSDGEVLHFESPARLKIGQEWFQAGRFLPWAARLEMMSRLNRLVFDQALNTMSEEHDARAINLSVEALSDHDFQNYMIDRLNEKEVNASNLWFDIPEFHALQQQAEFRAFCMAFKPLGCKIGLKHVGPHFSRIGELHDVGLNYLKVDASIIKNIDFNPGNQVFLRGLCMVAHAIDLTAIAEGVQSAKEKQCLIELGMDGMTGPGIRIN